MNEETRARATVCADAISDFEDKMGKMKGAGHMTVY
jgi:hypothetical protein